MSSAAELFPDGVAIVMAHPDDELLWTGSLLPVADRIVICFGPVPNHQGITHGRRQLQADYPLSQAHFLNIVESRVFNFADWPLPDETAEGLAIPWNPGRARDYRRSYADLIARLPELLKGVHSVVTHNPWGEYGHEHHIQLFRALESLQPQMGYQIWVNCYAGAKTSGLVARHLERLGPPTPDLPLNQPLVEELQGLYQKTSTWTWYQEYRWPETERFFPLLPMGEKAAPGTVRPLHWIVQPYVPRSAWAVQMDRIMQFARRRFDKIAGSQGQPS